MKKINEIESCIYCNFHSTSIDGMECSHPYWKYKGAYDNMIITQQNKNYIPEKCPLKKEELHLIYKLKKDLGAMINVWIEYHGSMDLSPSEKEIIKFYEKINSDNS